MDNKVYFQDSKGYKLCGILSAPDSSLEKVVIMVHGFTSNKNTKSWLLLTDLLSKASIPSLRIDLFAHGESEGKFEDLTTTKAVDSILCAIRFLKEKGYKKIGLIGSSFGGISSIMAASKTNDLVLLGLKSPVSDFNEVWTARRTPQELAKWKETGMTNYQDRSEVVQLKYAFFEDFKNNEPYKIAHRISVPTIIVHGDSDSVVPVGQSIKLSKLIPNCELVLVKGVDHRYQGPGEMGKLVNSLYSFILKNL